MSIEEMKVFLRSRGWSDWYHPEYWVHTKTVFDPSWQDYTNYGMRPFAAYFFEMYGVRI